MAAAVITAIAEWGRARCYWQLFCVCACVRACARACVCVCVYRTHVRSHKNISPCFPHRKGHYIAYLQATDRGQMTPSGTNGCRLLACITTASRDPGGDGRQDALTRRQYAMKWSHYALTRRQSQGESARPYGRTDQYGLVLFTPCIFLYSVFIRTNKIH
jgi:hypothetical protein